MKTAIIVPEYKEGQRVVETLKKILKNCREIVIVVDDGSNDNTVGLIRKNFKNNPRIYFCEHLINLGKGAAMKTGIEKAWELGCKAVIFVDADGQHDPKHINDFLKKLKESPIVFGYRLLDDKMPWIRKWGNILAAKLIKFLFGIDKRDLLSGYLGFRKEVYEKIKWTSCRYGVETEMATKIGKNKIPFSEVKIDTIYINKYKGVTILDALKILIQIPFWYFAK